MVAANASQTAEADPALPVELRTGPVYDRCDLTSTEVRKVILQYSHMSDVGAKGVEFTDCDFSYSVFLRVYFRNAKFVRCKFVGCEFERCNLRKAEFSECDFSYARFLLTQMDPMDLFDQLPPRPNVRRELARTLRKNAESIGDIEAVHACFGYEMRQTENHLKQAAAGQEEYYRKKYPKRLQRIGFRARLWLHVFSGLSWGHGESPAKVVCAFAVVAFMLGAALAARAPSFGGPRFSEDPAGAAHFASVHVLPMMLGVATPGFGLSDTAAAIISCAGALATVIFFGLFVTTLVRRHAKR